MNELIPNNPELNKDGLTLLADLFHNKIQLLENSDGMHLVLSKQKTLKNLRLMVERFSLSNFYAFIEVCVLGDQNNINDVKYSITFKNFTEWNDNFLPQYFRLVLDEKWTKLTLYQRSVDGMAYLPLPDPKVNYHENSDTTLD